MCYKKNDQLQLRKFAFGVRIGHFYTVPKPFWTPEKHPFLKNDIEKLSDEIENNQRRSKQVKRIGKVSRNWTRFSVCFQAEIGLILFHILNPLNLKSNLSPSLFELKPDCSIVVGRSTTNRHSRTHPPPRRSPAIRTLLFIVGLLAQIRSFECVPIERRARLHLIQRRIRVAQLHGRLAAHQSLVVQREVFALDQIAGQRMTQKTKSIRIRSKIISKHCSEWPNGLRFERLTDNPLTRGFVEKSKIIHSVYPNSFAKIQSLFPLCFPS